MISILTLNLRIESWLDGINTFPKRKEGVLRFLTKANPDAMGFQEMTRGMLDAFEEGLSGYKLIATENKKRGKREYTAIAYRKETLSLLASGTFWLSPKPGLMGSRFLVQSPDPRTCTWAEFLHMPSGRRFRYYNTHLDHLSPIARARGLSVIFDHMAQKQAEEVLPLFLGGDFNFTPSNPLYALCLKRYLGGLPLVDLSGAIGSTFHWFGKLKRPFKLDYLFTDLKTAQAGGFFVHAHRVDDEGRFLSDHDAIQLNWSFGGLSLARSPLPAAP